MTKPMTLQLFDGIDLQYEDCEAKVAEAFAAMCRSTWKSLPSGIRRVAQLYWEQHGAEFAVVLGELGGKTAGKCDFEDHVVKFDTRNFENADADLFSAAVGHELSHLFWFALDQEDHVYVESNKRRNLNNLTPQQEGAFFRELSARGIATEMLAREMTRRLGLPQDKFIEWFYMTNESEAAVDVAKSLDRQDAIWAAHSVGSNASVEDAKSNYFLQHRRFFEVAIENDEQLDWKDLEQVKNLINAEL